MHIPDGFIDAGTSLGAGLVAAVAVRSAARRVGRELDDRQIPLAGLVAAFVFAAQMLNFPIAAGTSGHLIGAVLAAVLVGPWAGALCVTVVVMMQALFADGGLSALGLNVLNLAVVAGGGGFVVFRGMRAVLPATRSMVSVAAGVAAAVSVVLAALAFAVEFAVGGTAPVSFGAVAAAMVGVHTFIGIGEGVITAMTVAAVLNARPDLVYGARDLLEPRPLVSESLA